MGSVHTNKQFDVELQQLKDELLQMGCLVRVQLDAVFNGLDCGLATLTSIVDREQVLDRLETQIDSACNHVYLCRHPVAGDFRWLSAVCKINGYLENIGDESEKIAAQLTRIEILPADVFARELHILAKKLLTLFDLAIHAFSRSNSQAATELITQLRFFDEYTANLPLRLLQNHNSDLNSMRFMLIVAAMERISNQIKNMGKVMIYAENGTERRQPLPLTVQSPGPMTRPYAQ